MLHNFGLFLAVFSNCHYNLPLKNARLFKRLMPVSPWLEFCMQLQIKCFADGQWFWQPSQKKNLKTSFATAWKHPFQLSRAQDTACCKWKVSEVVHPPQHETLSTANAYCMSHSYDAAAASSTKKAGASIHLIFHSFVKCCPQQLVVTFNCFCVGLARFVQPIQTILLLYPHCKNLLNKSTLP